MVNVARKLAWSNVRNLLLPPTCVLCGEGGQRLTTPADCGGVLAEFDLCANCAAGLPVLMRCCRRCAEPLPGNDNAALVCGACLRTPPRYHTTHCAFSYRHPVDHLIRALKYHGRLSHARVLGQALACSLLGQFEPAGAMRPEALIPVPLARARFNERGFNQAIEIAKTLQACLRIPVRADVVARVRNTREQADLHRNERRKNVRGAFAVRAPLDIRHVAIVDDVVTTGSTVNELARVLKRAGAVRIDVWAVARAAR